MNAPVSNLVRPIAIHMTVIMAALGLFAATARPALVVNADLGALAAGSVNLTGTTVGGGNNANNYSNSIATRFWGSEYVYQFTTTVRAVLSIASDDPNAAIDNDFFLLSSTGTTPLGAMNVGAALGELVEISGGFGIFDPGTYYLAIDAYAGSVSTAPGNAGPFNAVLTVAPVVPPNPVPATPGGSIATTLGVAQVLWFSFNHPGGAFSVDTLGSTIGPLGDSELFLFDSNGDLADSNDDIDFDADNFLSRITLLNLSAGTYFLAVGGYDTEGSSGFTVLSTSGEAGPLVINGLMLITGADPHLEAVSRVGNTQTMRLTATPGKTFLIEKSATLAPGSWVQDGDLVTLTTTEQIITRTTGPGDSHLCYRAREQ